MSNESYDEYADESYLSDEEPADLTLEEIQTSVFEFDPMFEFDADQYFDFTDTKALYYYATTKAPLGEGEWADAADWFAEIHEGHETEVYQYPSMEDCELVDDIDIGFGSNEVTSQLNGLSFKTPKKAERVPATHQSPPDACPTSPNDDGSRGPSRRAYTAMSPLATKTNSPLKSGAQRVRVDGAGSNPGSGNDNKAPKRVVMTGPQRLVVVSHTPPDSESPGTIETTERSSSRSNLCISPQSQSTSSTSPTSAPSSRHQASPSSPSNSRPRNGPTTSPSSKLNSHPQQRLVAGSSTLSSSTKPVLQRPRYADPNKPTHQTQAPVRSARTFVSRHHQGMVTRRVPEASKSKKQASTTFSSAPNSCSATTTAVPNPIRPSFSSPPVPSSAPSIPENNTPTENSLLKQVDLLLTQHKQKQKVAYEPRRFGIKEIKDWELRSGCKWHELTAEERQIANEQMGAIRKQAALQTR